MSVVTRHKGTVSPELCSPGLQSQGSAGGRGQPFDLPPAHPPCTHYCVPCPPSICSLCDRFRPGQPGLSALGSPGSRVSSPAVAGEAWGPTAAGPEAPHPPGSRCAPWPSPACQGPVPEVQGPFALIWGALDLCQRKAHSYGQPADRARGLRLWPHPADPERPAVQTGAVPCPRSWGVAGRSASSEERGVGASWPSKQPREPSPSLQALHPVFP